MFPIFQHLPREIQDMIWYEAARARRPDRRGAHFFAVVLVDKHGKDHEGKEPDIVHSSPPLSGPLYDGPGNTFSLWPRVRHRLTTPQDMDILTNPSAYIIDSALWTACRASREAMKRMYNMKTWGPYLQQQKPWAWPKQHHHRRPANQVVVVGYPAPAGSRHGHGARRLSCDCPGAEPRCQGPRLQSSYC
jgi:hypothetical protein